MTQSIARAHRAPRSPSHPNYLIAAAAAANHRSGKAARADQPNQDRRSNHPLRSALHRDGGGNRHDLADRNEAHAEDNQPAANRLELAIERQDRERSDSPGAATSKTGADKLNSDQGSRDNPATRQHPCSAISLARCHQPTARATTQPAASSTKTQHQSSQSVVWCTAHQSARLRGLR
jgi:hypothetical protein